MVVWAGQEGTAVCAQASPLAGTTPCGCSSTGCAGCAN